MDTSALIEGHVKFRDGKKWKTRWAVITKLSPVADCLQLQVYRDEKERARNGHTKASLSLQHFLGIESGFTLDKESHTLAIICQDLSVVLAFDNRERLIQWSVRIANNLGDGHQFLLQLASAPAKSKLTPGPVKLHITDKKFCLTGGIPPRLLGFWEVSHLRRYGVVEGRFIFEGGSRCGKGEGVHVLVPDPPQINSVVEAMDLASKGHLTRAPSRRYGSGLESPRKSLASRLSELRSSGMESSVNIGVAPLSASMHRNLSPTPRESRSVDELCSSGPVGDHSHGSAHWTSSDSSSRCDLDSIDGVSIANAESSHDLKHQAIGVCPSPSKGLNKPMPSAMERCSSCMSKLGSHLTSGSDITSPTWTMDLNGVASQGMSTSMSQSQVVPRTGGSLGSGNSDRLSISSHGSSGGITEYYYDTPKSALCAERHKSGHSRSGVHHHGHSHSGQNGMHTPCCPSSPQKLQPLRMSSACNTCHCQAQHQHHAAMRHASQPSNSNNENHHCDQQQQQNFHQSKAVNSHVGPFENYDFPKCPVPVTSYPSNKSQCGSVIDWSKKAPMDRSSIASTAFGSEFSEFYDTPRRSADSMSSSGCCGVSTTSHHHNLMSQSQCHPPGSQQQIYQNQSASSSSSKASDPMENYDVPPNFVHPVGGHATSVSSNQPRPMQHQMSSGRINGEGKMPLIASSTRQQPLVSSAPIYAQVDKSKKSHRPHHSLSGPTFNCDNLHIYQNSQPAYQAPQLQQQQHQIAPPAQPNYMNLDLSQSYPAKKREPLESQDPATTPVYSNAEKQIQQNYANMDFSLPLYANSSDTSSEQHRWELPRHNSNPCHHPPANTFPSLNLNACASRPEAQDLLADKTPTNPPFSHYLQDPPSPCPKKDSDTTSLINAEAYRAASASLPLRRSSSVPCKGGHANRGSSSSSDSGVSGDGGLIFEDTMSPVVDFGSLCLHESLPRKAQRSPPATTNNGYKNTSATPKSSQQSSFDSTSSPPDEPTSPGHIYSVLKDVPVKTAPVDGTPPTANPQKQNKCSSPNDLIPNRHYETIAEVDSSKMPQSQQQQSTQPKLVQRFKSQASGIVSDANSLSSGASDMSDYLETLSSCSKGSNENQNPLLVSHVQVPGIDLSSSPKRAANMKPRSGKEYFKIDRTLFN